MRQFVSANKLILIILFIFTFCHLFLFINTEGLYIDDWGFASTKDIGKQMHFANTSGFNKSISYLRILLLQCNYNVFLFRIMAYLFTCMTIIYLFKILTSMRLFSSKDAFYITLLIALSPLNPYWMRVVLGLHSFFIFLFFLGFYFLIQYRKSSKSIIYRFMSLGVFYLAFIYIPSLLCFYAIPMIWLLYNHYSEDPELLTNFHFDNIRESIKCNLKAILRFFILNLDFILLPFLFWFVKILFYKPAGAMLNYNHIRIDLGLLISIVDLFMESFVIPLIKVLSPIFSLKFGCVIILIALFIYKMSPTSNMTINRFKAYMFIALGFLFFFLGGFPYLAVRKIPRAIINPAHYQVLLPLGFAFVIYYSIYLLRLFKKGDFIFSVLIWTVILCFAGNTLYKGYRLQLDWFYQVALMENFRSIPEIKEHTTFIIAAPLRDELIDHRRIMSVAGFNEYSGMLKRVFGDEKRFMVSDDVTKKNMMWYGDFYTKTGFWNSSQWVYEDPVYIVALPTCQSKLELLKLFYQYTFDRRDFKKSAKQLLRVSVVQNLPLQSPSKHINWGAYAVEEVKKIICYFSGTKYSCVEDVFMKIEK